MNCLTYPGISEVWVAAATKFGKTLAGATALSKLNLRSNRIKTRWIAPIYRQSLLGMDYFNSLLPPDPHSKFKPGQMIIDMPFAHNTMEFWHGQSPFDLEGAAINGDVLDECAKMKEQVYISERTTKTRTKGPGLFISTPLGKNWFYTKCMEAKEHQEWSIKRGDHPSKIFIAARTIDNPYIDKEVIAQAQHDLPDRLFRQHYLAEFIDDGTVFTNIMECVYTDKLLVDGAKQSWYHDTAKTRNVVIGADWAKTQDYTVFIAVDLETHEVVGFNRFHRIPYTEQIRKLALFARKFGCVEIAYHDKTGVGSAIDDHLAYLPISYQGITFTNALKNDMVARLMTSLEQKLIRFPFWQEMIKELMQYEIKTTITGLPTYSAPSGKHDDIVCSLMLANMALLEYGGKSYDTKYLEDIGSEKDEKDDLESFYNDLVEDDD
jgi:hypothetical protein